MCGCCCGTVGEKAERERKISEELVSVALIDSGINEKYLSKRCLISKIDLRKDSDDQNKELIQGLHGTICAEILLQNFEKVHIWDIPILQNKDVVSCDIESLVRALEWCNEHSIAMIHMSLGTANYFDYIKLKIIIEKLLAKGIIIVSAYDNCNIRNYPAGYNGVWGVRADVLNVLAHGEYTVTDDDMVVVHAEEVVMAGKTYFTRYSNSFSAPLLTAEIARILWEKGEIKRETLSELLKNEKRCNKAITYNDLYPLSSLLHGAQIEISIPVVIIHMPSKRIEKLKNIFESNEYDVIAVSDEACLGFMIPKRFYSDAAYDEDFIQTIVFIYHPDILFICTNNINDIKQDLGDLLILENEQKEIECIDEKDKNVFISEQDVYEYIKGKY